MQARSSSAPLVADNSKLVEARQLVRNGIRVVDLSSHNANPPGVFNGKAVPISNVADARLDETVAALREFVDQRGRLPTAESRPRPRCGPRRRRSGDSSAASVGLYNRLAYPWIDVWTWPSHSAGRKALESRFKGSPTSILISVTVTQKNRAAQAAQKSGWIARRIFGRI